MKIPERHTKALLALGKEIATDKTFVEFTVDDIVELHDDCIERFGGSYGVRDVGLLESVTIAPYTEYFGEEQYPSVFEKAAKYMTDFASYQIFNDGNKRTAYTTAIAFLQLNGQECQLSEARLYNITMGIANKEVEYEDIVKEFKENSLPVMMSPEKPLPITKEGNVYIEVPFHENAGAKVFGARWDAEVKKWYVSADANPAVFTQWEPIPLEKIEEIRRISEEADKIAEEVLTMD